MPHPKLTEARKAILQELTDLVAGKKGGIELDGTIVTVTDPDCDPEFGEQKIGISTLRYDQDEKSLRAGGAVLDAYTETDEAEIGAEDLSTDELDILLDAAKTGKEAQSETRGGNDEDGDVGDGGGNDPTCEFCGASYPQAGDGWNGLCPDCADAAEDDGI